MSERGIDRMFESMATLYGMQRMVSTFGENWEPAKLEYVKQIKRCNFSTENLRKAVDALADFHPSFPPLPGEFVATCRKAAATVAREIPLLTDQKRASPEIVEQAMQAVKASPPVGEQRYDWALRVLARVVAKDPRLSLLAEQFALEALRNLGEKSRIPADYLTLNRPVFDRVFPSMEVVA